MPYYQECSELYRQLDECTKSQYMSKLLNRCHSQEQALLACMKKEYMKRKRESRKLSQERRERYHDLLEDLGLEKDGSKKAAAGS